MGSVCTVRGHVTEEGGLVVEERLPLPPGPVSVSVRSGMNRQGLPASQWVIDEDEWRRRKAMMDSAIGCLSDEEAEAILRVVEEEFERVDPDEWR